MNISGKLNILVVDNKKENLFAMSALLDDFDVNIITATGGDDTLREILNYDFALILMDVHMPEMDRLETPKIIHSQINTSIIFISARKIDIKAGFAFPVKIANVVGLTSQNQY